MMEVEQKEYKDVTCSKEKEAVITELKGDCVA
jgi:hypothetical protein